MTMESSLTMVHSLIREHKVFDNTNIAFCFCMKNTHENKRVIYNASSKTLSDILPDNDEIENNIYIVPLPNEDKPISIIFKN